MQVDNQGTVFIFVPEGDYEYEWLTVNLDTQPYQWFGTSLTVDYRFADDIIDAINYAGFVIDWI